MSIALTHIALSLKSTTKVAAKSALKEAGLKQVLCDQLLAEYGRIANLRKNAKNARFIRRFTTANGYSPVRVAYECGNKIKAVGAPQISSTIKALRLPAGTPAYRLDAIRKSAIGKAVINNLRVGTNDTISVYLTNDPATVGINQTDCVDWDKYRGSYKGWACNYKSNTILVPSTWRMRVERKGLACVDGMFTLDAAQVECEGAELFNATWAVNGRGNSINVATGYIARSAKQTYHGETIEKALAGLKRKVKSAEFEAFLKTAELSTLVAAHPGAVIRLSDARAIGACEYGIKHWCHSVGLDYELGQSTLADVYQCYLKEPRSEARSAILHVLRKLRK